MHSHFWEPPLFIVFPQPSPRGIFTDDHILCGPVFSHWLQTPGCSIICWKDTGCPALNPVQGLVFVCSHISGPSSGECGCFPQSSCHLSSDSLCIYSLSPVLKFHSDCLSGTWLNILDSSFTSYKQSFSSWCLRFLISVPFPSSSAQFQWPLAQSSDHSSCCRPTQS